MKYTDLVLMGFRQKDDVRISQEETGRLHSRHFLQSRGEVRELVRSGSCPHLPAAEAERESGERGQSWEALEPSQATFTLS